MKPLPCPRCGYHAPRLPCPHCGDAALVSSLAGPPPRGFSALAAGARALPMGIAALGATGRVKRWLLPPFVLTSCVFLLAFWLSWRAVSSWLAVDPATRGAADASWYERLLRSDFVVGFAAAGTYLALFVVTAFVAIWSFSVVYQAVAGPFFDVIQGRIERRWYGCDPRERLAPPLAIPTPRAVWISVACAAIALALLTGWIAWRGWFAWVLLVATPAPFLVACRFDRDYREWLVVTLRTESRTLFVSVASSAFAAFLMVMLSWTIVLPWIGVPTFSAVAGFASAITMLDIPFSRRGFTFGQRLGFVFGNFGAVFVFGVVTSLLFVVPFLGPIVGIPAASIGGQWLVCRLDKSALARRAPPVHPTVAPPPRRT